MSWLTDEDREAARRIAADMGPWTDSELEELRRIAESAPRTSNPHEDTQRTA